MPAAFYPDAALFSGKSPFEVISPMILVGLKGRKGRKNAAFS